MLVATPLQAADFIEQWGVFEFALNGPTNGNPFLDTQFSARFTQGAEATEVNGFYDGDGVYRVRFMPEKQGKWSYTTASTAKELDGKSGEFSVSPPSANNHGPVRVTNTFHFAYADGTPFRQLGTTCYAWTHQGDTLEEQTLKTLAESPFNKLRMCVFPKRYTWNDNEPIHYPFEGTPPKQWDFTRFNPAFFRHLEKRIGQLRTLGIEADLILFHPYDNGQWGFDRMPSEADDRYLRYVIARLAAYRNVWWSLANEYDFMKEKKPADWDRFGALVQASDPSGHLRSIHNGEILYNHAQPWVSHASIQNGLAVEDHTRAVLYRDVYRKPVVFDEVKYEGNIRLGWGNLSGEELVFRFWQGTVAGTYVGHGETYLSDDQILWWSKGGVLKGQSPARLAFLRKILEEGPAGGLEPIAKWENYPFAGKPAEYYLGYFGREARTAWPFTLYRTDLADGMKFTAEVIDTWNMTITPVDGVFVLKKRNAFVADKDGRSVAPNDHPVPRDVFGVYFADKDGRSVPLPGRPYIAVRVRRQP